MTKMMTLFFDDAVNLVVVDLSCLHLHDLSSVLFLHSVDVTSFHLHYYFLVFPSDIRRHLFDHLDGDSDDRSSFPILRFLVFESS